MKRREHFFCAKKTKQWLYSTIHLLLFSVAPFWTISAGRKQRTLRICLLHLFTLWFEWKQRIWYAADTKERTLLAFSGYSPKWRYAEQEEMNCWIKSLFCFLCAEKVFSSLHKTYFSGPWQCYLLGSQWDSHKPPGFPPKYLKLCSEDERSFYGFGTTWG